MEAQESTGKSKANSTDHKKVQAKLRESPIKARAKVVSRGVSVVVSSVLVYFELSSQKAREKLVRIQFLSFDLSFCLVFFYQSSSKARAKLAQNSLSGRFPGFPSSLSFAWAFLWTCEFCLDFALNFWVLLGLAWWEVSFGWTFEVSLDFLIFIVKL